MIVPNLSFLTSLLTRLRPVEIDEEPNAEPQPPEDTEPELEAPGIRHVGAWAGTSALANPDRAVALCRKIGIDRLDVVVNDHSTSRDPRGFDTFSETKLVLLCGKARDHGIDCHLMSWIMPHERYIDEAAEDLTRLCKACEAKSLQFDAEEPWTKARAAMPYEKAARRIADGFKDLPCEMGVNGIGYTPAEKFGPLAEVCDYLVPQCYATTSSGITPEKAVPQFYRRYRKLFGAKRIVAGLAAYRQSGIPGYTVESAMKACLAGAQALEGVDTVIYWSLAHIRNDPRVQRVIAAIEKAP